MLTHTITRSGFSLLLLGGLLISPAFARQWHDASGRYRVDAEFVTADETYVVLERSSGELLVLQRQQLSTEDQRYVEQQASETQTPDTADSARSDDAAATPRENADPADREVDAESVPAPPQPASPVRSAPSGQDDSSGQATTDQAAANAAPPLPPRSAAAGDSVWALNDGDVVRGTLVGFASQDLVVVRQRGDLYVNGQPWDELPPAYWKILPNVVSTVDDVQVTTREELEEHLASGGGGPFEYVVQGVQLVLDSGGTVTLPIGLLQSSDAKQVAAGFQRWQAAHNAEVSQQQRYEADRRERLMLDSYQRAQQRRQIAAQRQWKMMELGLLSVDAGVVDLWEVAMYPPHAAGYPRSVVVPAENSLIAQRKAKLKYPNWRVGATAQVNDEF